MYASTNSYDSSKTFFNVKSGAHVSVARISTRRPGLNSTPTHVKFLVHKVARRLCI